MSQLDTLKRRVSTAMHAVQAGVGFMMNYDPKPTEPKHLRTGVNSAMVQHAALVRVLINKGVITDLEYLEVLAAEAEAEQRRYEEQLRGILGKPVHLV